MNGKVKMGQGPKQRPKTAMPSRRQSGPSVKMDRTTSRMSLESARPGPLRAGSGSVGSIPAELLPKPLTGRLASAPPFPFSRSPNSIRKRLLEMNKGCVWGSEKNLSQKPVEDPSLKRPVSGIRKLEPLKIKFGKNKVQPSDEPRPSTGKMPVTAISAVRPVLFKSSSPAMAPLRARVVSRTPLRPEKPIKPLPKIPEHKLPVCRPKTAGSATRALATAITATLTNTFSKPHCSSTPASLKSGDSVSTHSLVLPFDDESPPRTPRTEQIRRLSHKSLFKNSTDSTKTVYRGVTFSRQVTAEISDSEGEAEESQQQIINRLLSETDSYQSTEESPRLQQTESTLIEKQLENLNILNNVKLKKTMSTNNLSSMKTPDHRQVTNGSITWSIDKYLSTQDVSDKTDKYIDIKSVSDSLEQNIHEIKNELDQNGSQSNIGLYKFQMALSRTLELIDQYGSEDGNKLQDFSDCSKLRRTVSTEGNLFSMLKPTLRKKLSSDGVWSKPIRDEDHDVINFTVSSTVSITHE